MTAPENVLSTDELIRADGSLVPKGYVERRYCDSFADAKAHKQSNN